MDWRKRMISGVRIWHSLRHSESAGTSTDYFVWIRWIFLELGKQKLGFFIDMSSCNLSERLRYLSSSSSRFCSLNMRSTKLTSTSRRGYLDVQKQATPVRMVSNALWIVPTFWFTGAGDLFPKEAMSCEVSHLFGRTIKWPILAHPSAFHCTL
jgi:hypothetical protein